MTLTYHIFPRTTLLYMLISLFFIATALARSDSSQDEMLNFIIDGADNSLLQITDAKGTAIRKNGWPDGGYTLREFNWFYKDGKVFTDSKIIDDKAANGETMLPGDMDGLASETLYTPEMYARIGGTRGFASIFIPELAAQDRISNIFDPINYGYKDAGLSLKQIISEHQDNITIEPAMLGNKNVYLLTYSTLFGKETQVRKLWVDPNQGFACIRREGILPHIQYVAENSMQQAENGVWFPISGYVKQLELNDKGEWIQTISEEWQVENCEVNVNLNENIFTLPYHLSPGMSVTDQRFSPPMSYVYGSAEIDPASGQQLQAIPDLLKNVSQRGINPKGMTKIVIKKETEPNSIPASSKDYKKLISPAFLLATCAVLALGGSCAIAMALRKTKYAN